MRLSLANWLHGDSGDTGRSRLVLRLRPPGVHLLCPMGSRTLACPTRSIAGRVGCLVSAVISGSQEASHGLVPRCADVIGPRPFKMIAQGER